MVTGTNVNGCQNFMAITQGVIACTGLVMSSSGETIEIKLYPNPTAGIFNLELKSLTKNTHIEIYNSIRQLILVKKINKEDFQFDLSNYANGLYYLKIKSFENELIIKLVKE